MLWAIIYIIGRAIFCNFSAIHHHDRIAHFRHNAQVMSHQNDGKFEALLDFFE